MMTAPFSIAYRTIARVWFCRRERKCDMFGYMVLSRDPARQSRRQLRVDQEAH